jgi:Domain of unknown function (DUF1998)
VLEIEPGEVLAEYRPALTDAGAAGLEVELFVYDTLAGGAGFSPQLVSRGEELFEKAFKLLGECPGGCDASCYRCLRNFRNKMDHHLLDRVLGKQLLEQAIQGGYPSYPKKRVVSSTDILFNDLERQLSDAFAFERDAVRSTPGGDIAVPIVARRRSNGEEIWLALSSPIAGHVPADEELRAWSSQSTERSFVCVDDLLIRRHLPAAVDRIRLNLG